MQSRSAQPADPGLSRPRRRHQALLQRDLIRPVRPVRLQAAPYLASSRTAHLHGVRSGDHRDLGHRSSCRCGPRSGSCSCSPCRRSLSTAYAGGWSSGPSTRCSFGARLAQMISTRPPRPDVVAVVLITGSLSTRRIVISQTELLGLELLPLASCLHPVHDRHHRRAHAPAVRPHQRTPNWSVVHTEYSSLRFALFYWRSS